MTPLEHYTRVADGFERILAGVTDWQARTPCPEWDARTLAAHVVDVHQIFLSRLDGSEPTKLDPDADVPAAWQETRAQMEKALTDHGDQQVDNFGGKAPFSQTVTTVVCADTLIHGWDLARATKQDDTLDLASVAAASAFLTPNGDRLRSPGGFGPEVTVPADASPQDRLLGFVGRDPHPERA
jgi:uncharacterized protein (TIGR03086 family)